MNEISNIIITESLVASCY